MNEPSYDEDQASTQHHIDKISSALSDELNQVSATALHTLMQCRDYIDELIAVVTEKQKEAETSVRALATNASAAIRQAQGVRQKLEEMRKTWSGEASTTSPAT
jgi:oligoendopeptidase F